MKVDKSSRHSKITGDFAENLVLYWLSKYGSECARVDHTGIDLIARKKKSKEVMGISVKGRSRNVGKEKTYIAIPNDEFDKVKSACKAFNCTPYFAIVVDRYDELFMFILSMEKLLRLYPKKKRVSGWKMTDKHIEKYRKDPAILFVQFKYETLKWF